MRIETSVTRLLGIDLPIVQAGMSWASSAAALPLAVSRAGGLGVIAAGPMRLDALAGAIAEVRDRSDAPFAVNLPLSRKQVDEAIELLLADPPPVLIASQGGPRRYVERFQDAGTRCLHVVASEAHAAKAAQAGVDGLVVVGNEAGGHPPPSGVSTLVMLRAVVRAVPELPIVASGGFADGSGLLAALALGAGAVQFGTRFLASEEANVHPAYKQAVLEAGVEDTRTVGREFGMIRALRNAFTDRMESLEAGTSERQQRDEAFAGATLRMAALEGDTDRGKVEAGQSAGLIGSIMPAEQIVAQIVAEYAAASAALPAAAPLIAG